VRVRFTPATWSLVNASHAAGVVRGGVCAAAVVAKARSRPVVRLNIRVMSILLFGPPGIM
jgi:hypothetical protein